MKLQGEKLTPHFSLSEFGEVPLRYRARTQQLALVLETIRGAAKAPIRITSGYRTPAHNKRIGGAKNSQHVQGRAADIQADGWSSQDLYDLILQLVQKEEIPKIGIGLYPRHVHIDIRPTTRIVTWSNLA